MNLIYRRLTYSFFILLFFILAPSVILYTQGYRYNIEKNRVQKIGILIASSIPKNAEIHLNDQLIKNKTTPAKINRLIPGDYEIKLTKEGHHDWRKRLPIYENTTTFAEDIILWKKSIPIQLQENSIAEWLTSPDKQHTVAVDNSGNVLLINLHSKSIRQILDLTNYQDTNIVGWSNTSKKIIITATSGNLGQNYWLVNIDQIGHSGTLLNNQYLPANTIKVKWDQASDNTVYAQNPQGIFKVDLFSQATSRLTTATSTDDFMVRNNKIYTLKNNQLSEKNSAGEEIAIQNIRCQTCSFINRDAGKIIILDENNHKIFFVDAGNISLKPIENHAKNIDWLHSNTLLFYDDWELWIYNFDKNEPELITRLGKQIQQAVWHPLGRHIAFATNNDINIIELDNRELRNIIKLSSAEAVSFITLNASGSDVLFAGNLTPGYGGIFELNIK